MTPNCPPVNNCAQNKFAEIGQQIGRIWSAISPNLVCEICPNAENKEMNDDADEGIVRKRTKPII